MRIKKLKNTFLDIISFNTPQAVVFNITSVFVLLAAVPTRWLYHSPIRCIFKTYLLPIVFHGSCPAAGIFAGCQCPACGMARGMSRLLHGDFAGAWGYNAGVFLVFIVMLVVLVINLKRSFEPYKKT